MYLLNAGLPFAKLTVCMSNNELAGLSRMIKAYNTPFLDEASYRQKHMTEFTRKQPITKVRRTTHRLEKSLQQYLMGHDGQL